METFSFCINRLASALTLVISSKNLTFAAIGKIKMNPRPNGNTPGVNYINVQLAAYALVGLCLSYWRTYNAGLSVKKKKIHLVVCDGKFGYSW
jgi:hypothetical protein